MAGIVFLEPFVRERHGDWERTARQVVGLLRVNAGHRKDDPQLTALAGELTRRRRLRARLRHRPPVGNDDLSLVMFSAARDSPGEVALKLIASASAVSA